MFVYYSKQSEAMTKVVRIKKFTGCTFVPNRFGAVCNVTVALNANRVEANQVQLFVLRKV